MHLIWNKVCRFDIWLSMQRQMAALVFKYFCMFSSDSGFQALGALMEVGKMGTSCRPTCSGSEVGWVSDHPMVIRVLQVSFIRPHLFFSHLLTAAEMASLLKLRGLFSPSKDSSITMSLRLEKNWSMMPSVLGIWAISFFIWAWKSCWALRHSYQMFMLLMSSICCREKEVAENASSHDSSLLFKSRPDLQC